MTEAIEKALLLLCEKVAEVLKKLEQMEQKELPDRWWYDLKTLCAVKNVSYKTLCQKKYLQPNFGKPEILLSGKKQWSTGTILKTRWLYKSDDQLLAEYQEKHGGSIL